MYRADRHGMLHRAGLALAFAALGATLPSCFCGDACDTPVPLPPSGTYVGVSTRMAFAALERPDGSPGLRVASDRTLVFEAEKGLVHVSYLRDGRRVDETWRVGPRRLRDLP